MSKEQGNCWETCPVIALIEGREDTRASMHDGLKAEQIAHIPNSRSVLEDACEAKGPRKPFFSLGMLACQSRLMKEALPEQADLNPQAI
jgi:hypothetical protein